MAMVSLRLNKEEEEYFKAYSKLTGKGLSELFKTALAEQIEDEFDLKLAEEGLKEFEEDPVAFSLDEMKKMYDL
ncbi:translation repressor RelB [Peptoniphilus sp. MSJ-1]|uniref:Translation repressor RelB n=1 Tax=Peptoniphilus ovalis TaxID=2841503 RepID=A0ABS6FI76_9FIRM|nr:DUF6290 family protein [Peptoniphilus ovalis]MBU5669880.1 translation repressor RelB [Peptoniphilus ovalis]